MTNNIFMKMIYEKRPHSIRSFIKYHKFIRELKKTTPNFNLLWQIAEFIKTLEKVSFYDNSPSSLISSSYSYKDDANGFIIHKTGVVDLIYKLIPSDDNLIKVEIVRKAGAQVKSTLIFHDENNIEMDRDDQELLLNIVDITMSTVEWLFKKAYKEKVIY